MKHLIFICFLAVFSTASAATYELSLEAWSRPRDGVSLAQMTPLREAVRSFSETPGAQLQLLYPAGEEGSMWAFELRSWLVALGIASEKIELLPNGTEATSLSLHVTGGDDQKVMP